VPVVAKQQDVKIVLPGATSAEGIAIGSGATFYAGDLLTGDIYRGDLQHETAQLFIDVPSGRMAVGMRVDQRDNHSCRGAFTGQAYVYDLSTGETVRTYQFANPLATPTIINDVTLTGDGAWFTDSQQPKLYFVPIGPGGPSASFSTLVLSGPAAEIGGTFPTFVGLNGIAATQSGDTLIVAHTSNAALYTVNPVTGGSAAIDGVSVPDVDGILRSRASVGSQNFNGKSLKSAEC
jgi:sugar lactone lactonase YvrE